MGHLRKKYSREFKIHTVELSFQRDNIKQLAEELDLHPNLIHKWRKEFSDETAPERRFPGNGNKRADTETEEVERLRRELAEVKTERDILKKAVGIFSKKNG